MCTTGKKKKKHSNNISQRYNKNGTVIYQQYETLIPDAQEVRGDINHKLFIYRTYASPREIFSNSLYRKYHVHNHKLLERTVTIPPSGELQRDRRTGNVVTRIYTKRRAMPEGGRKKIMLAPCT